VNILNIIYVTYVDMFVQLLYIYVHIYAVVSVYTQIDILQYFTIDGCAFGALSTVEVPAGY
jgi:hypothetical protein